MSAATLAHGVTMTSVCWVWALLGHRGGARGHFRRAPWSGDFRRPKLAERKKRASDVSKYLSTYVSVEKIAKSRKKNVTARTGIKLVECNTRFFHIVWYVRTRIPQLHFGVELVQNTKKNWVVEYT